MHFAARCCGELCSCDRGVIGILGDFVSEENGRTGKKRRGDPDGWMLWDFVG